MVAVAIVGVVLVTLAAREPSPDTPPKALGSDTAPQTPKAIAVPREFSAEGEAGKIASGVERVARPGNARVALAQRDGGRWICILAAGDTRGYDLDQGLSLDQFPALRDGGFRPVPPHLVRGRTSIYRSVAKTTMGYNAARGDRIIVILCPKDEWDGLALAWPAPASQ